MTQTFKTFMEGKTNRVHKAIGLKLKEQGGIVHVHAHPEKLAARGIEHHDRDDYGPTHIAKHRGHTLSVYQSGHHEGRPIVSVRGVGFKGVPPHVVKGYAKKLGDVL